MAIYHAAARDADKRGMGTTFTAVWMGEGEAYLAHVGDSRAYLLRDGRLLRVSRDHTLVEELVAHGHLTREQAKTYPHRNYITRALGSDATVQPDILRLDWLEGDVWLLCSDGLTNEVEEKDIERMLKGAGEYGEKLSRIVRMALGGTAGGTTSPACSSPPRRTDMQRVLSGRYELIEIVGTGGMAIVYRALDQKTGREVAVKLLRPEFERDEEFVRRFSHEAKAAAQVAHENIVNMLDVGFDGVPYIVMEFVRRANAQGFDPQRGQHSAAPGGRHGAAHPGGARPRAPEQHRAPRYQAAKHPGGREWHDQGGGFRHRPADHFPPR